MKSMNSLCAVLTAILCAVASVSCSQPPVEPGPVNSTGTTVHHTADGHPEPTVIPPACSPAWNSLVDSRLEISDDAGHGPDIGSAEWMHAVGLKSGVVDSAGHGPDPGSEEWCRAVDFKVFGRR